MKTPDHLVNEHFDDRYFDVVNALDEARLIYIGYNGLDCRINAAAAAKLPLSLSIGETGFGAGRNVVALMEYLRESGVRDARVEYNTVELYPITAERMLAIMEGFRDRVPDEIEAVAAAYRSVDTGVPGWHAMEIKRPFGLIRVNLWIGEALEMLKALEMPCDVWFLDGHGPKKNPAMWRPELLAAIGRKTKPGGSCATFTVAGVVKRGLTAAGFEISKVPGVGGKKEVLRGDMPF